jgi:hypothetical protein
MPGIDQIVEHAQEPTDIVEVQARGGFVQDVELVSCAPRAEREISRDLDALGFPSG